MLRAMRCVSRFISSMAFLPAFLVGLAICESWRPPSSSVMLETLPSESSRMSRSAWRAILSCLFFSSSASRASLSSRLRLTRAAKRELLRSGMLSSEPESEAPACSAGAGVW
ncbi:hypothetical protein EV126DRAFT_405587 [Verticillium dahliae]|nr:hypothetical protein EV126DRAFT_405587 [Verticillium dahliae]